MTNGLDTRTDRDFYVTVINGDRKGFLLGPFDTHQESLDNVELGRKLANKADAFAHFYAFGTASAPKGTMIKAVFGKGEAA